MKWLKQKFSNMRAALSVKTHQKPRITIIVMMLFINFIILIIAALIALAIDQQFNSFIEAFALGSVTWLLAPNAILEIENPQTLFLAVSVLLIGIILFSGTIIALITNALKDYFEKKQSGSGKVYLQNHILILNYNNKVPELISDLLHVKGKHITVLVLADVNKHYVEQKVRSAMMAKNISKEKLKQFNVLIKPGDPLNKGELSDSALTKSQSVIIMNDQSFERSKGPLGSGDLNIIKTLLAVGQVDLPKQLNIVCEIKRFETKEKIMNLQTKINTLKDKALIPICFDRRLGQIMAQTLMKKYTEDVYLSLFSFKGASIYPVDDASFDNIITHHPSAVPLERFDDAVFVLSDSHKHAHQTVTESIKPAQTLTLHPLKQKESLTVVIVGNNNKRPFIQNAFDNYKTLHGSEFKTTHIDHDALDDFLDNQDTRENTNMLLLSDERVHENMMDADVINSLIKIKQRDHTNIHIIAELLDPKNDTLIKELEIENTIISNKIVSLLLGNFALYPRTERFFDDLLTISPYGKNTDDKALHIDKADAIINEAFPLSFASIKTFTNVLYESSSHTLMPIGIIQNDTVKLFEGALHDAPFEIKNTDMLILYKL